MLYLQRLTSEEAVTVFLTSGRADGEKMSLVNVVLGHLICIKDTRLFNNLTKYREEETFNSFYRHPALTGWLYKYIHRLHILVIRSLPEQMSQSADWFLRSLACKNMPLIKYLLSFDPDWSICVHTINIRSSQDRFLCQLSPLVLTSIWVWLLCSQTPPPPLPFPSFGGEKMLPVLKSKAL